MNSEENSQTLKKRKKKSDETVKIERALKKFRKYGEKLCMDIPPRQDLVDLILLNKKETIEKSISSDEYDSKGESNTKRC